MNNELVSIIIPVYNRAKIIKKTIKNMQLQTYKNIEIIIVDDGSTDEIEKVINEVKKDQRIKFFRTNKNRGACFARNLGVSKSKGKYIAFQDSDDLWNEEKIYKQLDYLKRENADICICGMNLIYENGKTKAYHSKSFSEKQININRILGNNFISTQLLFGKKECFEEEKFDEKFPRFQDWDLGIRLVKKYNIVYLPEILVYRYLQKDSVSSDLRKGYIAGDLLLKKYSKDYEKFPKAKGEFLSFYSKFQELNNESSKDSMVEALKYNFNLKNFIKYILQRLGIYKIILVKKYKSK